MRLLSILTLVFILNTALMPILGAAHEQSHQTQEGLTHITWNDDQSSVGLFQVVHDEHHDLAQADHADRHSNVHQCHHISVLGIAQFIQPQEALNSKVYNATEPLLSLQIFPMPIEYPPKIA